MNEDLGLRALGVDVGPQEFLDWGVGFFRSRVRAEARRVRGFFQLLSAPGNPSGLGYAALRFGINILRLKLRGFSDFRFGFGAVISGLQGLGFGFRGPKP